MKINLKELYELQAELDAEIARNHNIDYQITRHKRVLALIVEIGELANETRCFKFWSNKAPSSKEIVMDEYADGIHFLLSLGIQLKTEKVEYCLKKNNKELTLQIHEIYKAATKLEENFDLKHYVDCFQKYLNLSLSLDMTPEDIINSYKLKLSVNHKRQETNY